MKLNAHFTPWDSIECYISHKVPYCHILCWVREMKGGFLVRNNTPSNTSVKEPVKARQRPLGLVRKVPSSSIESVPKFPPLKQAAERSYENLSATGNAIAVPPARESPEKLDPESRTSTSVSQHSHGSPTRKSVHSSKSTDSAATSMKSDEKTKEFKEALVSNLPN